MWQVLGGQFARESEDQVLALSPLAPSPATGGTGSSAPELLLPLCERRQSDRCAAHPARLRETVVGPGRTSSEIREGSACRYKTHHWCTVP